MYMGKEYQITKQGSLGLLALGHIGLLKWREVLNDKKKDSLNKKDDDKRKK